MASVYTDLAQAQYDTLTQFNLAERAEIGTFGGDLKFRVANYTLVGDEDTSDIIHIFHAPRGAFVLPHLCSVFGADPGEALTLKVGHEDNDDAYVTGLDAASGLALFSGATAGVEYRAPVILTEPKWIIATPTTATTLTAAAVVRFCIVYGLRQ